MAGGAKVRWQPNVGGRRPRVVVEGRRKSCSETERGTTAGAAWPEARRNGGRGLAWFSRRKSRREKEKTTTGDSGSGSTGAARDVVAGICREKWRSSAREEERGFNFEP